MNSSQWVEFALLQCCNFESGTTIEIRDSLVVLQITIYVTFPADSVLLVWLAVVVFTAAREEVPPPLMLIAP